MDRKKLLEKINKQKDNQAEKYVNSVKKIVRKNQHYYQDKEYATKFKDE